MRSVRTVKRIADGHAAQIRSFLEEAIKQVQKLFQFVVGIARWTRAIGLDQTFAFGRRYPIRSLHPRDDGKQSPPCVRISGFRLSGVKHLMYICTSGWETAPCCFLTAGLRAVTNLCEHYPKRACSVHVPAPGLRPRRSGNTHKREYLAQVSKTCCIYPPFRP